MKRLLTIALGLATLASCNGVKWTLTETEYGYNVMTQKRGQTIAYSPESGVAILTVDGYAFKDLNRNGELDVYEDWRLGAEQRAEDLAAQLTIEEIAGMMLYSSHQSVPSRGECSVVRCMTESHTARAAQLLQTFRTHRRSSSLRTTSGQCL